MCARAEWNRGGRGPWERATCRHDWRHVAVRLTSKWVRCVNPIEEGARGVVIETSTYFDFFGKVLWNSTADSEMVHQMDGGWNFNLPVAGTSKFAVIREVRFRLRTLELSIIIRRFRTPKSCHSHSQSHKGSQWSPNRDIPCERKNGWTPWTEKKLQKSSKNVWTEFQKN